VKAGIGRIDLDECVAKFVGELHGEQVEGGLGGAVAQELGAGVLPIGRSDQAIYILEPLQAGIFHRCENDRFRSTRCIFSPLGKRCC
jgi:hypothetical protein